ncbi:MAG: hypothetical protein Q8O31_04865 [Rhodocyclaceae bacterium]|nr:hypothetical protein [Rhodocyclaceae bacterium]
MADRVDEQGQGHEIGQVSLLHPDGSFLAFQEDFQWPLDKDMADGWFDGLDLLVCEHIAASIMNKVLHVAAVESTLHFYAGRTFLEVKRFDRHGAQAASQFWETCAADHRISANFRQICEENKTILNSFPLRWE